MTFTPLVEDESFDFEPSPATRFETAMTWIGRTVASVVLVAVVAGAVFVSVALGRGTWMLTPVLSGSMRPGLAVGGVAVSQRIPVSGLAVRDVIIFQRPDRPSEQVVHRIVRLIDGSSGKLLINTQGDANNARDPWTLTIRGGFAYQVRWSLPLVGYPAVAYQNHRGYFLLGSGVVLIVLAISFARKRRNPLHRRTYRRKRRPR